MYFAHWINVHLAQPDVLSSRMTDSHAQWIFVLLSRIEDHILADDMSLLRNLARASIALLKQSIRKRNLGDKAEETSTVGGEDVVESKDHYMSERSCWIIITTIASVWGQRDLWMDVDAMLAGFTE
jgi:Survival motor neuron (SMN) interacting protein 1 (SIP1)